MFCFCADELVCHTASQLRPHCAPRASKYCFKLACEHFLGKLRTGSSDMGNAQITLQTFEGLAMLRGLFRLLAILGNDPLVIPDQPVISSRTGGRRY
ncbi:hypothetical protein METHP14_10288 [Pseudomonas sp. P14-2025]